jgi:hypothetical protein
MWFIKDSSINFLWIFYRYFLVYDIQTLGHIVLFFFVIIASSRMKLLRICEHAKAILLHGPILMLQLVCCRLDIIGLVLKSRNWTNPSHLLINGLLFLAIQTSSQWNCLPLLLMVLISLKDGFLVLLLTLYFCTPRSLRLKSLFFLINWWRFYNTMLSTIYGFVIMKTFWYGNVRSIFQMCQRPHYLNLSLALPILVFQLLFLLLFLQVLLFLLLRVYFLPLLPYFSPLPFIPLVFHGLNNL